MVAQEKQNILKENLIEFQKRLDIAKRQKILTTVELAKEISESENAFDLLKSIESLLSSDEEAMLLSELCKTELRSKIKAMLFIGSTEPTKAGAHSKISFVKNKYNDIAFEEFSRSGINAKPDYASSFKDSCESVYDGRCEFCILPLTNSNDGRMMSFYALIERYELKICNYTEIEDEASGSLRLALLSRSCKEPNEKKPDSQNYVFEFSVNAERTDFISELLLAARALGSELLSIDSIPVEYALGMQKFFFAFNISVNELLAFRLYVALKNQSYVPIGIYQNKNQQT